MNSSVEIYPSLPLVSELDVRGHVGLGHVGRAAVGQRAHERPLPSVDALVSLQSLPHLRNRHLYRYTHQVDNFCLHVNEGSGGRAGLGYELG